MNFFKSFKEDIFYIDEQSFENHALQLFRFQAENNQIYHQYLKNLDIRTQQVQTIHEIPFLPISLFKSQMIKTGNWKSQFVFESSGTTGQVNSKHHIRNADFYAKAAVSIFQKYYGPLNQYHLFALLPSYLERKNASLVFMIEQFIKKTNSEYSGFYLDNHQALVQRIREAQKISDRRIFLFGVTFALLDLAEYNPVDLHDGMVMDTGGMKGRRKEMVREEVHSILKERFNVQKIHSEYGMTELTSQAYSQGHGRLQCPVWMKVLIRDMNDPFSYISEKRTGGINIIDLANVDTCAFIETADLGRKLDINSFEVLGRFDNSEVRGCNLMIS